MWSLKSIIAEVFENIVMRYLMCSLNQYHLTCQHHHIIHTSSSQNCLFWSLCCGEILSWSSQQVVYRWLGKPAIFQELFHRWLRLLATFQPLFSSQILQNRFLVIKLFKSLILHWMKLKWFKFVNANQTSLILWRGNQWKIGKALRQAFYIGKIYWAVNSKSFISLHYISDWLTERKWTCSCSLSGPSLHLIGYSSKDVRLILNSWDYLHKMIIQRAQALSLH